MAWSTVGNMAHLASLTNIMLFALSVVAKRSMFDEYWKEYGFCVSNPDEPYWTSHDLCLYADLSLASVLGVIYFLVKNEAGMKPANDLVGVSILGIVGHGIAHGAVAAEMRNDPDKFLEYGQKLNYETVDFSSPLNLAMQIIPGVIFWVSLLKSAVPKGSWSGIAALATLSIVSGLFIPKNLGFTYVQTVLFLVFDINEMLKAKEEKNFEYAMYPIIVGIPTGIVGWIESTMCTKGVIDLGGHLIYDAYIPLGLLAFYMICYVRSQNKIQTEKEGKKKAA